MIKTKKIKKGNNMKKILITIFSVMFYSSVVQAEKVECELLTPIQKVVYKAYCQAEAKKGNTTFKSKSTKESTKELGSSIANKTNNAFKKLKVNTDSKLFKTGKYSKEK